jgi:hypothetical protein
LLTEGWQESMTQPAVPLADYHVTRKMALTPSGLARSVMVRTLSDSASGTGPGSVLMAMPKTRKPN